MNPQWRKTLDLIIGTLIGVFCGLLLDWKWLLILVVTYAFFKSLIFAFQLMKLPVQLLMDINENQDASYKSGQKIGYVFSQFIIALVFSLILTSIIASLNKLAFSYAKSRTVLMIVLVVGEVFLIIVPTLKLIWKKKQ